MGVGGSPRATASGSALCAARVWPVCGTRRRVDSGKSDVRPRWRASPKNVALFLAKMYHSGKNSKPKVERGIFPALRTRSGGPHGSQTGSGADRASQPGSRGSIPALPLTSPRSSCRDHTPPVPSVSVGGLGDVSSLRSSMTRKTRTFRKSPAFYCQVIYLPPTCSLHIKRIERGSEFGKRSGPHPRSHAGLSLERRDSQTRTVWARAWGQSLPSPPSWGNGRSILASGQNKAQAGPLVPAPTGKK